MNEEKNQTYCFDVETATKHGLNEAILLYNIIFWIRSHAANTTHFYDGHTWIFNSIKAFIKLFPFLTRRKIEYALSNLVEKKILIKGNYNKMKYDKTTWYALSDEAPYNLYPVSKTANSAKFPIPQNSVMDSTKQDNGFHKTAQPIPIINTNINTTITSVQPKQAVEVKPKQKNVVVPFKERDKMLKSMCEYLGRTPNQQTFDNWYNHYLDKNINECSGINRWGATYKVWEQNNPPPPPPVKPKRQIGYSDIWG